MNRSGEARLLDDPYMEPFAAHVDSRAARIASLEERLLGGGQSLAEIAAGHEYYGLHRKDDGGWVFREWAPNADGICLVGDFNGWEESEGYRLERVNENGDWEGEFPSDALKHHDLFRLRVRWNHGVGDRLPAYVRRVVQDEHTKIFNAQVWQPEAAFAWKNESPAAPDSLLIYEAHVGMAQEEPKVGSYLEFAEKILPRIAEGGYNTLQLMAVQEHPYYGSFGYHVANFFACSSRFGTPEELKQLIDTAHGMGLRVVMDLVHSHSVKNELEGLARFDGTTYQYFHEGERGDHVAWDSRCFDYAKPQVLHFLMSNLRFWLDEYRFDGFRFDGVTSMLYKDHGLGAAFVSYDRYFDDGVDEDAYAYLGLANQLVHELRPDVTTIAEDVSGMPGLVTPAEDGGCGFDFRLAMGVPDCWFKLSNDTRDEDWDIGWLWHELTNRRREERTVSYVESHDQALVGGKTFFFELAGAATYEAMRRDQPSHVIDRAMALHKMARLATVATAGHGYMTFIGNEFGHPEWVDFPRVGNDWSYDKARRQWSLRDDPELKFGLLADFDRAMLELFRENGILTVPQPELPFVNAGDQVLSFGRGDFRFIFNFHPSKSFADYPIPVGAGSFGRVLDTDAKEFGGGARIAPDQEFFSKGDSGEILTYLPTRTALVLQRN